MFLLLQVFLKKIFYELSDAENLDYGLEERWRVSGWLNAMRAVDQGCREGGVDYHYTITHDTAMVKRQS